MLPAGEAVRAPSARIPREGGHGFEHYPKETRQAPTIARGEADMVGVGRATGGWLRQVRGLFGFGTVGGLSDGQLLDAFVSRRGDDSEAAFEELMHRHGSMVLRVCRRVLRDPQDAEDAFQATFLVLAHRAGAIRRRDSVASWLFGVSQRVAAQARLRAARSAPASSTSPSRPPRLTGPPTRRKNRRP